MLEMSPREVKARLDEAGPPPVLLDVREAWEVATVALPGAVHIPVGEIAARLDELDAGAETVVLCHHGIRSRAVCHYLDAQQFAATINLTGGIDAWARDIDPGLPTY